MIIKSLLVKIGNNGDIKIINLDNGCEAALEADDYALLTSVTDKTTVTNCTAKEIDLLEFLEVQMGLEIIDGQGALQIRRGDFENLDVYITNECNLFCRHCYFFDGDKHAIKKHFDFELLTKTILEAESMGLYQLKLCGGEPLAYYRIVELVEFLSQRDIRTTIVCNGLLLEKIISIANPKRISLVISLDGFEEAHDYLRGRGNYAKTKRNIELALGLGFDVAINMVIYDKNADQIEAFASMIEAMGINHLNIQVIRPTGQAAIHLKANLATGEDFLRKIHQNELAAQAEKILAGKSFCTSCKTGMTIDFNHHAIACTLMLDEPAGNLETEGLKAIHERSLRENPIFDVYDRSECAQCELFMTVCAGGCRARAKRMTGSMYSCDHWIPFLLGHPKFQEGGREAWEYLLI